MEQNFVTHDQALALKELGFDEPCFAYFKDEEFQYPNLYEPFKNSEQKSWFVTAPLKQQAFKWFRDKYNIHGIVAYYGKNQWFIEVLDYKGNELIQIEDNTFWSYGEAESICIDKLIQIIKERNNESIQ